MDDKFKDLQIEFATHTDRHFELKDVVTHLQEQMGQAPNQETNNEKNLEM